MTLREARLVLSEKEFEALRLKTLGYSNDMISQTMNISRDYVRDLFRRIRKKLGNDYQISHENGEILTYSDYSTPESPKNWKRLSGKEILKQRIATGWTRYAFSRYGKAEGLADYLDGEIRLAYAINGLGDRNYLMRKRGEILKVLVAGARHRVVRLRVDQLNNEAKTIINCYRIPCVKVDYPGNDESSKTYSYICKNHGEYAKLIRALVGNPDISYDNMAKTLRLCFDKAVYSELIRIYKIQGDLEKGKHIKSEELDKNKTLVGNSHIIVNDLELEQGQKYFIELMIAGAPVSFLLKVS